MSWDGVIIRAPGINSVNDFPKDFEAVPLGSTKEIGDVLQKLFPDQHHSHGYCLIEGDDFWLEFSFGYPKDKDTRTSIGVRSNAGLGAVPILAQVCDAFDARLVDAQTGEFADMDSETRSSMQEFAEWRDRQIQSRNDSKLE